MIEASAIDKHRMDGGQIAHIVGPKGEVIYYDEHARIKIQFPWEEAVRE